MPPTFYYILHLTGIFMLFTGYGALLGRALIGAEEQRVRKLGGLTAGIGLLFMLVAGFGLMAKFGYGITTGWLLAKLLIWFVLGGLIALINRKPALAGTLWWVIILLGVLAASLVYTRPFTPDPTDSRPDPAESHSEAQPGAPSSR